MSPRRAECFGTLVSGGTVKGRACSAGSSTWRGVQKRDTAVGGSTLKGNKAQESIGLVVAATQRLATDSDMEQSLEVGAWVERKKVSVATRVLDDGSQAGS